MRKTKNILISGKSLDEIIAEHALWIETEGKEGQIAHLWGADLRGTHLREAHLNKAYLRGANLSEADLSEADLYEADLRGAYLHGANLNRAHLRKANLSGANLSGAILCLADLSGANLNGATNISRAKEANSADFTDAKLDDHDRQFLASINETVKLAKNDNKDKEESDENKKPS
jgi:uncharacterized protein YjbI with pentapeptide repeats